MRAISAAQEKVLAGNYSTHVRVQIKDSGGTWRNMTSLDGRDWLIGADWGEGVDQLMADANVSLVRDAQRLSLSPMIEASKLNLLTGSYSPLVDIGREIKIEVAVKPSYATPVSADWFEAFRGCVESIDFDSDEMQLQCSDLGSKLARSFIKRELVYPCMPNYHRAPVWTANTDFEDIWPDGARTGAIRPTVANGYAYCLFDDDGGTTGASEPTWPTTRGSTVSDGTLTWKCMGLLPSKYGASMWEPSSDVSVGDIVAVETGSGYLGAYRCTTAGTTSPDSPSIIGWSNGSPTGWQIIPVAQNSTLYRVAIGGTNCDYTSDSSATVAEICAGLTSAINTLTGTHGLTATNNTSNVMLAGLWALVRVSANISVAYAPDGTAAWEALFVPVYSPFAGRVQIEDLIDMLLRDWCAVSDLSVPSSPGWVVGQYQQQKVSLLSALDTLSGQIGWSFRYKWSSSASAFLPTLYATDRSKSAVDRTITTDAYDSIDAIGRSLTDLRNSVDCVYSDMTSDPINGLDYPRRTESASDATSIAAYGEQWCEVAEASSSLIDSPAEAAALAAAVLSDLKDPLAEQSVSMRTFPFVELDDRYTFSANGVHYDVDQTFAVVGYRHSVSMDSAKTTLQTRQRPSGGFRRWKRRISAPGVAPQNGTAPTPAPTVSVTNSIGACVVEIDSRWPTTESVELFVSSSAGLTPNATNFKQRANSSTLYVVLSSGTYYGRVIVRDSSGNASAPSAEFVLQPT